MHINGLSELCLVNDPWKADKHNEDLTRLFVLDSNFSQGTCSTLYSPASVLIAFCLRRTHNNVFIQRY